MRYSRENFDGAEEQVREAETREKKLIRDFGNTSELEKLADVSYANVAGVLDFLRGRTGEQRRQKLEHLYNKAHDEALALEKQRAELERTLKRRGWHLPRR
jgi:hypothetical protein